MARRALSGGAPATVAAAAALLATLLLLARCDDARPPSAVDAVVRLGEQGHATVQSSWRNADGEPERGLTPVFARSFEQEAECDGVVTPIRRSDGTPSPKVARSEAAAARGQAGMRFETATGALLWWLPVRPDTPYVARVRARRPPMSSGALPARAGELAIVEFFRPQQGRLQEGRTLAELEPQLGKPIAEHRAAADEQGAFGDARVRFTTSGRTNSVLLLLFGGAPADVAAALPSDASRIDGAIDFDELALFELPLIRVLPPLPPAARRSGSEWERDVTIGGETRSALLAPPPAQVRVPCTLPNGRFRLTFGYGVAEEARPSAGRTDVRFEARLETASATLPIALPSATLAPRARAADAGWRDVTFEGVGRGEKATLVIATSTARGLPSEELAAVSLPLLLPEARPAGTGPNVVLISVDTLRPDRLGAYGAKRPDGVVQSPAIDALAAQGIVFEEARAQSPYTLPSHATLFTGLHPTLHGVERFDSTLAPDACVRLIDRFREAGYVSAAFTGGGFLAPVYGLWRGFDRWTTLDPFLHAQEPLRQLVPRPGEPLLNAACWQRTGHAALRDWLAEQRTVPFFLFLHTYAVHNYRPPAEFCERFGVTRDAAKFDPLAESDERTPSPADLPDLRNRYDASIAAADAEIGRFLALLDELDLARDTIVVLLSDHGEEFLEHGGFGHGRTLYDEVLRVPLIVRAPGLAPRRDATRVTLADVAPTLLALCGLPALPAASGRVLLPEPADATGPFSAAVNEIHLGELRALEVGGVKLIEMSRYSPIRPRLPGFALHALAADPRERSNLARYDERGALLPDEQQPQGFRELRALLDAHFRDLQQSRLPDAAIPGGLRSPDLDALGY